MKCPSEECHTNVQDMRKLLNNLAVCTGKKISTNLAIGFLAFVLTFSSGFLIYTMAAEKKQNQDVSTNKENIAVIKEELKHISISQHEVKESIKRIEQKQITEAKIIDAVKKALRDD